MKMEKYKILTEFVKDISVETKDVQTYLFVKDYISKYQLSIDIGSKPTKNKLVEITTTLKFEDNKNKIKNFDSIDEVIETNKRYKYDYLNPILFRKFIKEIIINYSQAG